MMLLEGKQPQEGLCFILIGVGGDFLKLHERLYSSCDFKSPTVPSTLCIYCSPLGFVPKYVHFSAISFFFNLMQVCESFFER